jgi:acyl carrier protein
MNDIEKQITDILSAKFKVARTSVDSGTTFASLNFDSLATIELALGLEREFGVAIEDGEITSLTTVGDAAVVIASKKATA